VAGLERMTLSWSSPRSAAEARELLSNLRILEQKLPPLQRSLEEARMQAAMLGNALPTNQGAQLEDCSARCRALQAAIRERREQLTSSTQGESSFEKNNHRHLNNFIFQENYHLALQVFIPRGKELQLQIKFPTI
jgi:hypothetical protein